MHTTCRMSRRWHQQFCRSPNFASHQICLQQFPPFREYRQVSKARVQRSIPIKTPDRDGITPPRLSSLPSKSNVVVREYEADPNDKSKLKQVEPNPELRSEIEGTRMELAQLDRELATMRQGPFGPQSKFMKSFPEEEREQLLQALAVEGLLQGEQEDLLTMAELERLSEEDVQDQEQMPKRLGVTLKIPRKDQAYIRHFNKALQAVENASNRDVGLRLTLWRWYLRCQQQVNNFSNIISDDVWQFLWDSQAQLEVRPQHLVMLARDMLQVKVVLNPQQWLTYIESLHATGDTSLAIEMWENQKPNLKANIELCSTFWQVGVEMFAATGQPSKAQELAFNALNGHKVDPQVLVPVIAAWARSERHDALIKAWACYLKLKEQAGASLKPEMYEQISNAFLDTKNGDMALSVFKDMLLMKGPSSHDSREVYKEATKHFEQVLQNASTEEQINRVGLSSLLILPRQYQNRFFFTSWIKKLIGEQRVDSASMVVELMYERGIAPDAKPLNGIIGAWLREGSTTAQRKAESMAWSMIEARIELVQHRSKTSKNEGKYYRTVVLDDRNQSVQRKVPAATIETFSILLQYYTRRQNNIQAEKLTNTMINSCHIQPNSYIMNHWLFGDLRAGRVQVLWDKYCNLKQQIMPDLETFAALWDAAKVQYSKTSPTHAKDFPSARELFGEMRSWNSIQTPTKARKTKDEFSADLYEQIVRVFCLSTDLPGTFLAIHYMARLFDFYPTDNAVRLVCGQAARLLPQEDQVQGRSIRSRRSVTRHKSAISQVAEIIGMIEAKRKIALVGQGVDADELENPEAKSFQTLRLTVLTEFMRMFMQKAQVGTGSYQNDLKIAAQTMHVDMDDIDLSITE